MSKNNDILLEALFSIHENLILGNTELANKIATEAINKWESKEEVDKIIIERPSIHGADYEKLINFLTKNNFNWIESKEEAGEDHEK